MKLKLKAYAPNREPQLGICDVRRIDFEFGKITISNGQVATVLDLEQVELMRYTGQKDDNGKEIFEKDIVWINGTLNVVTYSEDEARFVAKSKDDYYHWALDEYARELGIKIVGNIYENPELLEA